MPEYEIHLSKQETASLTIDAPSYEAARQHAEARLSSDDTNWSVVSSDAHVVATPLTKVHQELENILLNVPRLSELDEWSSSYRLAMETLRSLVIWYGDLCEQRDQGEADTHEVEDLLNRACDQALPAISEIMNLPADVMKEHIVNEPDFRKRGRVDIELARSLGWRSERPPVADDRYTAERARKWMQEWL
jgi:hypothetical protein